MAQLALLVLIVVLCATLTPAVVQNPFPNFIEKFGGAAHFGAPYNVSYDARAIKIAGQRTLLLCGSVHYPRSTPDMWPDIFRRSVNAGLNCIETYFFWNLHEKFEGEFDFTSNNGDFVKYIQLAQQAGLYVIWRIGPYVCAEWNYGGFPYWLKNKPDMVFRSDSASFKEEMQRIVKKAVEMTRDYFADRGGPIILLQVENEYGKVQWAYGANGDRYIQWASDMANSIDTGGLSWIMCEQENVANVLLTCNGYYCDDFLKGHYETSPGQPGMWTEHWMGWYQKWGDPRPSRPSEDISYAVARFFAYGGTTHIYYMWHGGTNFGRNAGGPFITTSYDYDVALNEYGYEQEPKYSHSARLHYLLFEYSDVLLNNLPPTPTVLGSLQESLVWGSGDRALTFLSNSNATHSFTATLNGRQYEVPRWAVLIVGANGDVLFDTSHIQDHPEPLPESLPLFKATDATSVSWLGDFLGVWFVNVTESTTPLEQLSLTQDLTDYLWYETDVRVEIFGPVIIRLKNVHDVVHVFFNGEYIGTSSSFFLRLGLIEHVFEAYVSFGGTFKLQILTMTSGLNHAFIYTERVQRGLLGTVIVNDEDITNSRWLHQPYLYGEFYKFWDVATNPGWRSNALLVRNRALTWYKYVFPPTSSWNRDRVRPVALDLRGFGRGYVWVNGVNIGRFWNTISQGTCEPCDYAGEYQPDKCRSKCGEPTQIYYHVPESYLNANADNVIILLEEIGGDPSSLAIVERPQIVEL